MNLQQQEQQLTFFEYMPEYSEEEMRKRDKILYLFFQESLRIESANKETRLEHIEALVGMVKEIVEGGGFALLED